jgi:hypothetical protein
MKKYPLTVAKAFIGGFSPVLNTKNHELLIEQSPAEATISRPT